MSLNYFAEYNYKLAPSKVVAGKYRFYVASPIQALNEVHKFLQLSCERDGQRKITRPKLKPEDYRITRLYSAYDDRDKELTRGTPETIESDYDLPNTANPDLNAPKPPKPETAEMDLGELSAGRLSPDLVTIQSPVHVDSVPPSNAVPPVSPHTCTPGGSHIPVENLRTADTSACPENAAGSESTPNTDDEPFAWEGDAEKSPPQPFDESSEPSACHALNAAPEASQSAASSEVQTDEIF